MREEKEKRIIILLSHCLPRAIFIGDVPDLAVVGIDDVGVALLIDDDDVRCDIWSLKMLLLVRLNDNESTVERRDADDGGVGMNRDEELDDGELVASMTELLGLGLMGGGGSTNRVTFITS